MLRRLALKDFAIVRELEVEFGPGFTVLTGETGAGKSILIDALQLALGGRGEALSVRDGAPRCEVLAEFDVPESLRAWLEEAGFDATATLLLRRSLDAQGRSRAWVNGSGATVGQLREAAEHLVEIHGQHAWQSLTRAPAVRALLDAQAGLQTHALHAAWTAWRQAIARLEQARQQQEQLQSERERLQWQVGELSRLAPQPGEWEELNAEHTRLANAQSLIDAVQEALGALHETEPSAAELAARAQQSLSAVARFDAQLQSIVPVLQSAQAQLQDAVHSLRLWLRHGGPDPARLQELDQRVSNWLALARRHRRAPTELPGLLLQWQEQLRQLQESSDLQTLEQAVRDAEQAWTQEARAVSKARQRAAAPLGQAVTQAMQTLGMAGGRFEVRLQTLAEPQSFGMEEVEFLVAGHAGATPRPLAKVASGGELSRLALAVAVSTLQQRPRETAALTLVFDEIDAGVGGAVADSVGRLMKQLGAQSQVLAVTHLAQVAACADAHWVVSKSVQDGSTTSQVQAVSGEARVGEVARMLGGERLSGTSRAHAKAMLGQEH